MVTPRSVTDGDSMVLRTSLRGFDTLADHPMRSATSSRLYIRPRSSEPVKSKTGFSFHFVMWMTSDSGVDGTVMPRAFTRATTAVEEAGRPAMMSVCPCAPSGSEEHTSEL